MSAENFVYISDNIKVFREFQKLFRLFSKYKHLVFERNIPTYRFCIELGNTIHFSDSHRKYYVQWIICTEHMMNETIKGSFVLPEDHFGFFQEFQPGVLLLLS